MWGPVLVPVWVAAIVAAVWFWARFAGRRSRLARMILDDRQRQDALADIHRIWNGHDREVGR